MNNRYLYRAKRIDNGEWVEGYLVKRHGLYFIYDVINSDSCRQNNYEVDPSTICQCTGATDESGKLIWENDILMGHLDDIFPEDATYVRVMWHNNGFCTHQNGYDDDYEILEEFDQNIFEVCGNIFDNPELMELN